MAIIGFAFIACDEFFDIFFSTDLTGTVTIEGTPRVGQTLTANTDALGGSGMITYEWKRGGNKIGTDARTYVVQSADVGSTITVTVSRAGYTNTITSNPTAVVVNSGTVNPDPEKPDPEDPEPGDPKPEIPETFIENFEYADNAAWNASPWTWSGGVILTTPAAESPNDPSFGNSQQFVKLPRVTGGGRTVLERTVNPTQPSALNFTFMAAIRESTGQNFKVYVNGVERGSYVRTSIETTWRTETILLNSGEQTIRFEMSSGSSYTLNNFNAVFIDRVSLVPDVTDSVILYPRGDLQTYVGAPENEKIKFYAQAFRSDGTERRNASGFVYSGHGVNSNTGVFTPTTAANHTISVSIDGKTASRNVTVHPENYLRLPYTYPGTGITYNGFTEGTEGSNTHTNPQTQGRVTITYPTQRTFSADGFFTLEGLIDNNPAMYNYALVRVQKNNDPEMETSYYVRDNFKQRIWLRFGPGSYTVNVWSFTGLTINTGPADGAIIGWSGSSRAFTFDVTNTRNDGVSIDGVTPDKRFLYPSFVAQSDDFRITNLVADLTYGLTDNVAKIKALHDYIVFNTAYDFVSAYTDNMRKKQDALAVLGTRYFVDTQYPDGHFFAVCEGYSNLAAALIRAAGIETKIISGLGNGGGHVWNNVHVNGSWKFLDVTWNSPVRDMNWTPGTGNNIDFGPYYVQYNYFLLDTLNGVNNSHTDAKLLNDRSLITRPPLPSQRGVPDGWY